MMCCTWRPSTANWITDSALRSEWATTLATLRCTNNSPGNRPTSSLAGTRLSAQPIQRYCGFCCSSSLVSWVLMVLDSSSALCALAQQALAAGRMLIDFRQGHLDVLQLLLQL